ncbi:WW domain containing protein [Trichomonas vaginalis G3]|uniref:WW domain containing protein n=1 Tax=Trichomonas vaginalis (strain ATCC PRA-98 / G3) TaxID=412133 RepID=A2EJU2_TRIV3|nr:RH04127P family [Trichomonas vaginalis G3]EAY07080.1 WW domain containing protein [Trichomonas vaginalis G3]KAI5535249.1 RH04127P family [Trichomonas vaginalis G3]|eukprot:XP_001319303.1 WW domain containing protein [Trichomonas vaginalis G3]
MDSSEFIEMKDPNLGNNPTDEEIAEYAQWLGADPETDQDLYWIAREALTVPLPAGWKIYQRKDGTGDPFYFNSRTGESLWDHPLDEQFKQLFIKEKAKKEALKSSPQTFRPTAALGKAISENNEETKKEKSPVKQDLPPTSLGLSPTDEDYEEEEESGAEFEFESNLDELNKDNTNNKEINNVQEKQLKEMKELIENHQNNINKIREQQAAEQNELNGQIAQLQAEKERIQKQINTIKEENSKQIAQLKSDHEKALKEENDNFQKQLNAQKSQFTKELNKLKEDQNNSAVIKSQQSQEIQKLNEQHEISKKKLLSMQTDEINKIKAEHEKEKSNLILSFVNEITDMKNKHENELQNLKKEHDSEKKKLTDQNNNDIKQLKEKFDSEIKKLTSDHENALKEENNKFESQKHKFDQESSLTSTETTDDIRQQYEDQILEMKMKYEEQIKLLKKKMNSKANESRQIKALSDSHDQNKRDLEDQFEEEIQSINLQHQQEINKLKRQNQRIIQQKNAEMTEKLNNLNEEFENLKSEQEMQNKEMLDQLMTKHKKMVTKLKKQNQEQINSIKEEHEEEIEKLEEDHRKQLDKMKQKNTKEIDRQKEEFEKQLMSIQQKAENSYTNSNTNIKPITNRNYYKYSTVCFSQWPTSRSNNLIISDLVCACSNNRIPFYSFDEKIIFSAIPRNTSDLPDSIPLSIPPAPISSRMQDRPTPLQISQSALGMPYQRTDPLYPGSPMDVISSPAISSRISKSKSKASKTSDQFDNTCNQIIDKMQLQSNDIMNITQGFKNLVSDQNREMSRLSMDFQQQSASISRAISGSLSQIESSFRDAVSQLSTAHTHQVIAPPVSAGTNFGKIGRRNLIRYQRDSEFQDESTESALESDSSDGAFMYEPKTRMTKRI